MCQMPGKYSPFFRSDNFIRNKTPILWDSVANAEMDFHLHTCIRRGLIITHIFMVVDM